jgi:hypothetical protein
MNPYKSVEFCEKCGYHKYVSDKECLSCRLDPEGGTHKGIKRTELLLD